MDPFLHFMDARSMILIKIIGSYLLLYTAQTVPTHPESFNIDCFENGNQTYVKVNQNQRLLLFLCRNTAAVVCIIGIVLSLDLRRAVATNN